MGLYRGIRIGIWWACRWVSSRMLKTAVSIVCVNRERVGVKGKSRIAEGAPRNSFTSHGSKDACLCTCTVPCRERYGSLHGPKRLLHFCRVLIHHEVGIGAAVEHDVGAGGIRHGWEFSRGCIEGPHDHPMSRFFHHLRSVP